MNIPQGRGIVLWLLLIIWTMGWAKLLASGVNMVHSRKAPHWWLDVTKFGHLLLIPFVPLVFAFEIFSDPAAVPGCWCWQAWGGLSTLGFLGLCYATYRYHFPLLVYRQISETHNIRDSRTELAEPAVGNGPHSWIVSWRINDQLKLDVVEKRLRAPGLPSIWDGLSLIHLGDLHFRGGVDLKYFRWMADIGATLPCDLLIFSGDLLDNQSLLAWAEPVFSVFQPKYGKFFVLGNHDWLLDHEATRQYLVSLGWIDLAGKTHLLEQQGHGLLLSGAEDPWMSGPPEIPRERPPEFHIHVSHSPDGIDWAHDHRVDLMLSGHTHGGQIQLPFLGPVYSPSWYGCKYCGGTYEVGHTLLHVSRGISARDPLRIRCLPELPRLVLTSHR